MNFAHDDEMVSSLEDTRIFDLTKSKKRKNSGSNRRVSNKGFMEEEDDDDALPIGKVLIRRGRKPTKRKAENGNTHMEIGSGGHEAQLLGFEQKNPKNPQNPRSAKFCEGEMVWAKVKSHPWWPGQIYNPTLATATAKRSRRSGHVLVAFFGDATFGWFVESNLIPFEPTYLEKSKQTASRSFCEAVEDAVDELGRRATLGLMCGCRQSFSWRPKEGGYVEVCVPGWDTPVVYPERLVKEARDGFSSNQMLGFVKKMAVAPWCGEDSTIAGIKCAAEVRAYRSVIATKDTADYRKALRLDGERAEDGVLQSKDGLLPEQGSQEAFPGFSVKEQNGHFQMTERKGKSIYKVQASPNEDKYLFKRRNVVGEKQSSAVGVTVMGDIKVIETNQQTTLVGEGENADDISKYVFQKRNQHERGAIHVKERSKKGGQAVHRKQHDLQEAKRRKREITNHTSLREKKQSGDKSALKRRWREIDPSNECLSNIDQRFPDRIDMKGVSDESKLIQTLVSNAPQNEAIANVSDLLPKKKLKKSLQVVADSEEAVQIGQTNQFIEHPSCTDQRTLYEVVKTDKADTANTEGNVLCARPEDGGPHKLYEFEVDGFTELANVQARLAASSHQLAFDDGAYQGSKDPVDEDIQSVNDNATPMRNQSESQGMGSPEHVLGKVDEKLVKVDVVKGQVINPEETEISIVSKPHYTDSFSDLLDVGTSPVAQENLENICQDSKTSTVAGSGSRSKTNIAGVALPFAGEGGDVVCQSPRLLLISDHRVVKKPEGSKTLVTPNSSDAPVPFNDEKLSVPAVASKHSVNSSNKGHLFDSQFTGNGHAHEIAEAVDDVCRVRHDGNHALHPDRSDGPKDDDRGCSACPSGQDPCHNISQENVDSGCFLCQLVKDLRSLAIDPFYGSERGCQENAIGVILRFKSLVYQKLQYSSYFEHASDNVLPSLGIETEADNKQEKGLERPLMPLSSYVDASVRYGSSTSVSSKSSETAPDATSNIQPVPKLHSHTSRTLDVSSRAKEIKKLKFDAQFDDHSKRSKKMHSSPEKSAVKTSSRRLSGMPGGDLKEPIKQRKKPSRSYDQHKTPEEPMALSMKFPQGFALPSEVQLKARFVRFGQLDISGTRVYSQTNCARVIFKSKSDAEAAYKYAIENSMFGQANVNYKLKQMFPPKETVTLETCSELPKKANATLQSNSELPNERKLSEATPSQIPDIEVNKLKSSVQDEPPKLPDIELRDSWPSASSDGTGFEALNESVLNEFQSSHLVQLKSCLKKPDETGNINSKEYTRVTFLLDKEHRPDLYDRKNVLFQTGSSGVPLSLLSPHSLSSSALGPNPPDITDQMLYLLKICNEIVGDVRSTMGYVPYHLFGSNM